jgi:hypothetical protein
MTEEQEILVDYDDANADEEAKHPTSTAPAQVKQ